MFCIIFYYIYQISSYIMINIKLFCNNIYRLNIREDLQYEKINSYAWWICLFNYRYTTFTFCKIAILK